MLLVLRHEAAGHLGFFENILKTNGRPFVYRDLGDPLTLAGHTGVLVLGGPQSANDAGPLTGPDSNQCPANPELAAELTLIREAIGSGVPVLGICLGAQLIARALGSRVYKNAVEEIGWGPVHFTEAASGDPVFGLMASPTTFFHWHAETFDLPADAVWLAHSAKCRNQAFRFGRNVYGLQFHPEVTPAMILDWSSQPSDCTNGEGPANRIDPYAIETSERAAQIVNGWLSTF